MKVSEICELLQANVICGEVEHSSADLKSACASDLMSDILAFAGCQEILITGLSNPQVIRTAGMMDMKCVILVRGKQITEEMVSLGETIGLCLLQTNLTMYETCGRLYKAGILA